MAEWVGSERVQNVYGWGEGFIPQEVWNGSILLDLLPLKKARLIDRELHWIEKRDRQLWLEVPVAKYAKEHLVNAQMLPPDFNLDSIQFESMDGGPTFSQLPVMHDKTKVHRFRVVICP
jgi:hypothetical protein